MDNLNELVESYNFEEKLDEIKKEIEKIETTNILIEHDYIQEFNQIKKIFFKVKNYIKIFDSEFFEYETLNNILEKISDNLDTTLKNLKDFIETEDINHLVKGAIPHLLICLKTLHNNSYAITKELNSNEINELIKEYSKTIEQNIKSLELNNTLKKIDEIKHLYKDLLIDDDKDTSLYTYLNNLEEEIEKVHEKVLIDKDNNISLNTAIIRAKNEIEESKNKIDEVVESLQSDVTKLNVFFDKVFGKENEFGIRNGGLDNKITKLTEDFEDYQSEQDKIFKTLIKNIDTYNKDKKIEIENLLQGATTVGLSKSYSKLRFEYKNLSNKWSNFFIAFVLTIPCFLFTILLVNEDYFLDFYNIIKILPITTPFIWLAWYASKRRAEYQILEQEYAHKEAFTKSYSSFKEQLKEFDENDDNNDKLIKELIKKSLIITSKNPTESINTNQDSMNKDILNFITNKDSIE